MKGRPISYSARELEWIEAHSSMIRREAHARFVARFGRSDVKLSNYVALCKRHGWITGRTGQFEKGQESWNKGKSMPFNANSARTQFKKGQLPHNTRGPGHESVDPKDGYVWMIAAEKNPHTGAATHRVMKHRYLWEKANGPVPDGYALKCLDGDKSNTDPSNWTAVPRALLPRLSGRWTLSYDDAPDELKPTLLATAKLEHAIRETRKGQDK